MNVNELAACVLRAFKTTSIPEAFDELTTAFWKTCGTKREICDMVALAETTLRTQGNEAEANFCQGFRTAIAAEAGSLSYVSFIAEIVRQTKWVQIPAPTKVAEEYVKTVQAKALGAVLHVLVRASRNKQRREALAQEQRQQHIKNIARRTVFAIGTCGATELASAIVGEDVTDFNF